MNKSENAKAFQMMNKGKGVEERASKYFNGIKKDLQRNVIDSMQSQVDRIKSEIFELEDFSLETDVNRGVSALSEAECNQRFNSIIQKKYELKLKKLELKEKKKAFNELFKG